MSESAGRLARRFGLSRTALLYYHRIGLLVPSGRSASGYREYAEADVRRLEAICRHRRLGLTLEQIRALLDGTPGAAGAVLDARLEALDAEIETLREQQRVIVRLLSTRGALKKSRALDKARWVAILRGAGLDDEAMHRWHVAFERQAPKAHQDFLASLGIEPAEVRRIRKWSAR